MPRGVPKAGVRVYSGKYSKANRAALAAHSGANVVAQAAFSNPQAVPVESKQTDAQIDTKLKERFGILKQLSDAAVQGDVRALIVSGPAGLGKSFTVEESVAEHSNDEVDSASIKGYIRATGLYQTLYEHRHPGSVVVFDDADSVFFDDVSLNLLKAACDSTETRRLSWLTADTLGKDEEEGVPSSFEFEGSVIFITNLDFDSMIEQGGRLAPHLAAMVSRAHYIDLQMKTRRDYFIRIKQVCAEGMLKDKGLNKTEEKDVLNFIEEHLATLREVSLRTALKIGALRKQGGDWEKLARVTCLKNQ